jgi:hypothetical protein
VAEASQQELKITFTGFFVVVGVAVVVVVVVVEQSGGGAGYAEPIDTQPPALIGSGMKIAPSEIL